MLRAHWAPVFAEKHVEREDVMLLNNDVQRTDDRVWEVGED